MLSVRCQVLGVRCIFVALCIFLIITDSGEAREYDIGFKDLPDIPGRDIRLILLSAVILPDTAEKTPGIPQIRYNQVFFNALWHCSI
ncbi:Uncharacterized protein dnm_092080 [Desulfonema magnum]|uniref:Uncharacterized protein n=1 Tax=Desulfonema magnum TaxID=45655 RepID=A0A975BWP0_9BACT|nr:Uncharacterized protein dnm_092080 [Desulfonema magnum]